MLIVSELATGSFSQSVNIFTICPEKLMGPVVPSSTLSNKSLHGSSLKCNKHINHGKGRPSLSSRLRITPFFHPLLVAIPSHPVATKLT